MNFDLQVKILLEAVKDKRSIITRDNLRVGDKVQFRDLSFIEIVHEFGPRESTENNDRVVYFKRVRIPTDSEWTKMGRKYSKGSEYWQSTLTDDEIDWNKTNELNGKLLPKGSASSINSILDI